MFSLVQPHAPMNPAVVSGQPWSRPITGSTRRALHSKASPRFSGAYGSPFLEPILDREDRGPAVRRRRFPPIPTSVNSVAEPDECTQFVRTVAELPLVLSSNEVPCPLTTTLTCL
jgi:hypothetical protein